MIKTFVFKLYKSKKTKDLHHQIDIAAQIYNHSIALCKRYFKMFGKYLQKYKLQKHLTKLKKLEKYGHWSNVPSQAIQDITDRIERAYQLFFKQAKTSKTRPPSFKKTRKYKSITLKQSGYKISDDNSIKIGKIKFKFFKSRDISGKIKTLTIKRDSLSDIYLFFACEIEDIIPKRVMTSENAGFDFGLKTFLTISDGAKIESPLFFKTGSKKIKQASKSLSNKKRGSNNRKKARLNLARSHKKIVQQRKDYHFKTAKLLTEKYDHLFFEDLSLKGMQSLWGQKIGDLGFSDFLSIVKYYSRLNGAQVNFIDRFYPSSKTCNKCKYINKDLSLRDRSWQCAKCKIVHERDLNAAINIHIVGASTIGLGNVRPTSLAISA